MSTSMPYRRGILEVFSLTLGFLCLSSVITQSLYAFVLMLSIVFVLKMRQVSWIALFRFVTIPVVFATLGLISIVLVLRPEPSKALFTIPYLPLSVTLQSIEKGIIVFWRAFNALLSLYILIGSTTVKEKIALVDKLHIPQSLVELGILSYRYICLLDKKRKEIYTAQKLRLGYISYTKSFHSTVLLLSSVFIYSIKMFRLNYQALLTRGYTGRLYYPSIQPVVKDRWWYILTVILCTVALLWSYNYLLQSA